MKNKKKDKLKNQIEQLELTVGKKRFNTLTPLITLFIFVCGLILNLSANIIDNLVKELNNQLIYKIYAASVLILASIIILLLLKWTNDFYMKPINKMNKEIDELRKKLDK